LPDLALATRRRDVQVLPPTEAWYLLTSTLGFRPMDPYWKARGGFIAFRTSLEQFSVRLHGDSHLGIMYFFLSEDVHACRSKPDWIY
jgi:hypothetical protein